MKIEFYLIIFIIFKLKLPYIYKIMTSFIYSASGTCSSYYKYKTKNSTFSRVLSFFWDVNKIKRRWNLMRREMKRNQVKVNKSLNIPTLITFSFVFETSHTPIQMHAEAQIKMERKIISYLYSQTKPWLYMILLQENE